MDDATASEPPITTTQTLPLIPLGETASRDNYHFSIAEVITGSAALDFALDVAVTTQILPPAPGYTYTVVRLNSRAESGRTNMSGRSIKVVGNAGALYQAEMLVEANGRLGANKQVTLAANDGEATLGFVFVTPVDDPPQALLLRVPFADDPNFYLALHADATGIITTSPANPPNTAGVGTPAPVGTTVTAGDWEITVLPTDPESETAGALRQQFVPGEGGLVAQVHLRYFPATPVDDIDAGCLRVQSFSGLQGSNVVIVPYNMLPTFVQLPYLCLEPGGSATGWLLVENATGATPSVAFNLPGANPPETRYLSLR